jgi:pyruvate dehydrogenase E1 component beta subunit
LQPLNIELINQSVRKTGKLLVVDGGWKNSGIAGEIISRVTEESFESLTQPPIRLNPVFAPAPTSPALEKYYYTTVEEITKAIEKLSK